MSQAIKNIKVLFLAIVFPMALLATNGSEKPFRIIGPAGQVCAGHEITLKASGNSNYDFQWYPASAFANANLQSVVTPVLKTTTYSVVRTNKTNGKQDSAYIKVSVEEDQIEIIGDQYVCQGDSTFISIPLTDAKCTWNNDKSGTGIWVSKPGIYSVEAIHNCIRYTGRFYVKSVSEPLALITTADDLNICKGEKVTLTSFGNNENIKWSTGELTKQVEVSTSSRVELVVTNECGVARDVKQVTVHEIDASFIPSKMKGDIPFSIFFQNESKTKANDKWFVNGELFSSEKHAELYIEESGDYKFELERTNEFGCKTKMSYPVVQATSPAPVTPNVPLYKLVIFPNSFTPNGDGLNDEFTFQSNYISDVSITVFDRWGRIVFHSDEPNASWNGHIDESTPAKSGMYVYKVQFEDLNGKIIRQTKTVNLLR